MGNGSAVSAWRVLTSGDRRLRRPRHGYSRKAAAFSPHPSIKRDRLSSDDSINAVGDDGQTALANRAIDRDVRFDDFRPPAALDHVLTLLFFGDRLEPEQLPDRDANFRRHLAIAESFRSVDRQ